MARRSHFGISGNFKCNVRSSTANCNSTQNTNTSAGSHACEHMGMIQQQGMLRYLGTTELL